MAAKEIETPDTMFKILGIFVLLYTLFSAATGAVWAKAGISMRKITRQESPGYFWVVIVLYLLLGTVLVTIF